jgi:hypothetical protein
MRVGDDAPIDCIRFCAVFVEFLEDVAGLPLQLREFAERDFLFEAK